MKIFIRQYGIWIVQLILAGLLLLNTLYTKSLIASALDSYVSKKNFDEWKVSHKELSDTIFKSIEDKLDMNSIKLDTLIKMHMKD